MSKHSGQTRLDLIATEPSIWKGDHSIPLYQIIKWKQESYIIVPDFQREYVWDDERLVGWANTIIEQNGIGCIVTYQLCGKGPNFLADGFQRLTATLRFIEKPAGYGFQFGPSEAQRICETFFITLQHRHYQSHVEAMKAFQNLNKGTSLTPAEFYKGILTLSDIGKIIWKRVPPIALRMHTGLSSTKKTNRKRKSALLRDSLSLFFQYLSGETGTSLWNVTNTSAFRPVEKVLMEYIEAKRLTIPQIEKTIDSFNNYLEMQIAHLKKLMEEAGQSGRSASPTALRWILHLTIWRKNNKQSIDLYEKFVISLLECLKPYGSITSRFVPPNEGEEISALTLGLGTINHLGRLCEAFNVPLHKRYQRKSKKKAAPGYHVSHSKPFSKHGNGETIIEPAPRNIARGAKEIQSSF